MDSLAKRRLPMPRAYLESEPRQDTGDLIASGSRAKRRIHANCSDVFHIRPDRKMVRQFLQRRLEHPADVPRPGKRGTSERDERNLFGPEVQIDDAVTRPQAGSVSQQQVVGAPSDLHTADAVARLCILGYPITMPQVFINSIDNSAEPRVTLARTTLSHRRRGLSPRGQGSFCFFVGHFLIELLLESEATGWRKSLCSGKRLSKLAGLN
jgi:hypothetical protein